MNRFAVFTLIATLALLPGSRPLAQEPKPPAIAATKLSEVQRKKVYWDGVAAEHRAMKEARRQFPGDPVQMSKTEDRLLSQYQKAVWTAHRISEKQFWDIMQEGVDKKWPSPPTPRS